MNILITGGTGLVGKRLASVLIDRGMHPRLLSRVSDKSASIPKFAWDIDNGVIDVAALAQVDVVIHLAGANIAEGRWTARQKKEILSSRVQSTRLLFEAIKKLEVRPITFICASATGYYGMESFEHESVEADNSGDDFLAQVCKEWEGEADRFADLRMRVVKLRTGVVLDQDGGALQKMTLPIKYFAGAHLGSGRQYVNWIHWKDWCQSVVHLMNHKDLNGSFNLTAPSPVTNAHLTRLIAKAIGRPLWMPKVPAFALKLLFGDMATVILEGHRVSSKKLENSGYQFFFSNAETAVADLLGQD